MADQTKAEGKAQSLVEQLAAHLMRTGLPAEVRALAEELATARRERDEARADWDFERRRLAAICSAVLGEEIPEGLDSAALDDVRALIRARDEAYRLLHLALATRHHVPHLGGEHAGDCHGRMVLLVDAAWLSAAEALVGDDRDG